MERLGGHGIRCVAELDSRLPYLDHHRPGGKALLGTVMGIELMARAARLLLPAGRLTHVYDVQIGPAYLVDEADSRQKFVEATATFEHCDNDTATLGCEIRSGEASGEPIRHFAARLRFSMTSVDAEVQSSLPDPERAAVGAADIYRVFFHGPLFQVIASARSAGDTLIAQYAHSHMADPDDVAAPRVIEFCLQTAGLFELAASGRLMIPHAIGGIQLMHLGCKAADLSLRAVARRSNSQAGRIDVEAIDGAGRRNILLCGYETVPLPFAADAAELRRLRNCFGQHRKRDPAAPPGETHAGQVGPIA